MSNGRAEMREDGGALLRRRWIGIASLPRFWTDVGSGLSAAWSGISAAAPKIIQPAGTSPDMQQQQAQAYMLPPIPTRRT